ncbi:Tetratricopeptide repeat protein 21B, partial [Dinochytrium kinnereticum]
KDHEAIQELQAKLTVAANSSSLTDMSIVLAALFYLHIEAFDEARSILKRLLDGAGSKDRRSQINQESAGEQQFNIQPGSVIGFALVIMGWVDLKCESEIFAAKSVNWFDRVLECNPRDLDVIIFGLETIMFLQPFEKALFGRLYFLRLQRRQLTPALDITSQIIVYYPNFVPAYIERMNVLLEMGAWDQVLEAAQRLSSVSPDSVDGTITLCLVELCKEGRVKVATNHLSTLSQILSKFEPDPNLFYELGRSFSRISNRSPSILGECALLLSKAIDLNPGKSEYKTEMGYVQLYLSNMAKAKDFFKSALSSNSNDTTALQ